MDQLRAMSVFRRVAERGSLSAASSDLGLARGAASAILAQLEEHLGVRLIERTTRRLRLTEDGEQYLERACRILDEVKALEEEVGGAEREARGRLRVQVPTGLARIVVAPALPRFLQDHPLVEIEILSRNGVPDFVSGQVDAAVVIGELPLLDIAARQVGRIPYLTVASPTYLETRGRPQTPEDLAGHCCITMLSTATGAVLPWRFRLSGREESINVSGRASFESAEAAMVAAIKGLGILQLASYLVYEPVRKGQLVQVMEAYRPGALDMYLVHPRNRHKPKKLRVFEDFIIDLNRKTRRDWRISAPA